MSLPATGLSAGGAAAGRARPPVAALHPHGRLRGRRRCRSSSAATAATSRTSTASATSTRSPASSPSRSATATARRSGRRPPRRCASCPSTPTGAYAHPRAIELAAEVASLAPGDLNRVFFVLRRLGGGRVGLEARAPVPRRPRRAPLEGDRPQRRLPRHDDGRALDQRHRRRCARRSSRSSRTSLHVRNTNRYHRPPEETEEEFTAFLLDDLEETIDAAGPGHGRDGDHGAGAERGRRVHAAGGLLARACARSATATGSCSAPTR